MLCYSYCSLPHRCSGSWFPVYFPSLRVFSILSCSCCNWSRSRVTDRVEGVLGRAKGMKPAPNGLPQLLILHFIVILCYSCCCFLYNFYSSFLGFVKGLIRKMHNTHTNTHTHTQTYPQPSLCSLYWPVHALRFLLFCFVFASPSAPDFLARKLPETPFIAANTKIMKCAATAHKRAQNSLFLLQCQSFQEICDRFNNIIYESRQEIRAMFDEAHFIMDVTWTIVSKLPLYSMY